LLSSRPGTALYRKTPAAPLLDVADFHLQYQAVPTALKQVRSQQAPLNEVSLNRAQSLRTTLLRVAGVGIVGAGLALSSPALAQVYFTVKQLLSEQFKAASAVSFTRIAVDPALNSTVQSKIGRGLPKPEYVVYVAKREQAVVGYAVFDEERGEHEMIDFATFFDASGNVVRTEVVAYREAYGSEIRRETFRKQFLGRSAKSGFKVGQDIDAISGATLSSESMSRAVQRAAVLVDSALLSKQ
jgi:Na+-translocating ferredoxin:NAD+ oxidoreductase subunit G